MAPKSYKRYKRNWNHLRHKHRHSQRRKWRSHWKLMRRFPALSYHREFDSDGLDELDELPPRHEFSPEIRAMLENPQTHDWEQTLNLIDIDYQLADEDIHLLVSAVVRMPSSYPRDADNDTWEHALIEALDPRLVIALLESGGDHYIDFGYPLETPLSRAIEDRQWEKARILIKYGADPEICFRYAWIDWYEKWEEFLSLQVVKSANKV
jgi:hypothetical protein